MHKSVHAGKCVSHTSHESYSARHGLHKCKQINLAWYYLNKVTLEKSKRENVYI